MTTRLGLARHWPRDVKERVLLILLVVMTPFAAVTIWQSLVRLTVGRENIAAPAMSEISSILAPLLVIAAALLTWNLSARLWISRWTRKLEIMASAKGLPDTSENEDSFSTAPRELRDLSAALANMNTDIAAQTQSLNLAISQKDALIREIHHRVKNSIQIVMSLLALQSHQLNDPIARKAIEQTRARVSALALAERKVGECDATGVIDLKPLLEETVSQSQHQFDGMCGALSTSQDLTTCIVSTSAAVPLAMFVNEVLICACERNALEPQHKMRVVITLKPGSDARARLVMTTVVANGAPPISMADDAMSLRLMKALAMQLSGSLEISQNPDGQSAVTLAFPLIEKPTSRI